MLLTPLQKGFLYDLPQARTDLEELIIKYNLGTEKQILNPPKEAVEEFKNLNQIPTFNGFDAILLKKLQNPNSKITIGPMFTKIKELEIYRLFTPALLHIGLLHILFNMLWLFYLGKQM